MGTLTASTSLFDPSTDLFLNGPSVFEDQSGFSIYNFSAGTLPAASLGDDITGAARDYYAFFGAEGSEMYFDMDDINATNLGEVNALRAFVLGPDGTLLQQIDNGSDAFVDLTQGGIHHVVVTDDGVDYLGNFEFSPVFFIPPEPTSDYRLDIAYSRYSLGNDYAVTEFSATDDFETSGAAGQFSQMLGGDDFGFFREENDVVSSASLSGDKTYYGGSGNDILQGALTGSDTIYGGSGDDILSSGLDVALFFAGVGDDVLDGGSGADTILANSGDDLLRGSDGEDELYAASGDDTLIGGDDADVLDGGQGDDVLEGGNGSDDLLGGSNADRMYGGSGADFFDGGTGADYMHGGTDIDVASYENSAVGVRVALSGGPGSGGEAEGDVLLHIEDLIGSEFGDELIGDSLSNEIEGGGGNDTLNGGAGADLLRGGANNDTLNGGTGSDEMFGGTGDDRYFVSSVGDDVTELDGEGTDTVISYLSSYTLGDHVERLELQGAAVTGTGNALSNTVVGNGLDNTLDGGAGADYMGGGAGDDLYFVDSIGDVVIEIANRGTDTVNSTLASYTLTDNVERLELAATAVNGTGNALANTLVGNAQGNILNGAAGADFMVGGNGNDRYFVATVGDRVIEYNGQGIDTVISYLAGYTLEDQVERLELQGAALEGVGNELNNTLVGNAQDNTLRGEGGTDYIRGGAGADDLYGGVGADVFVYNSVTDSPAGPGNRDTIFDFEAIDRIALSNIDANGAAPGNAAFSWLGTAGFTGTAGELRFSVFGSNTIVQADIDGDSAADMEILLMGYTALNVSDFNL